MGFLYFVSVNDVSNKHLCPGLMVCLADGEVVGVFLPSRCELAVVGVDGGFVFPSLAVIPDAFDVPAVGDVGRSADDRR